MGWDKLHQELFGMGLSFYLEQNQWNTWLCFFKSGIFSPNPQVGLRDIEGKKLPNGEHPAIHWNRHKKLLELILFSFLYFPVTLYLQVFKAVGDGVEWIRRSDLYFVRPPLGWPGIPTTSSACWKVYWEAEKLVSFHTLTILFPLFFTFTLSL